MIKNFIKRLLFGHKGSSEAYIKHLRNIGMKIGDNVTIYSPRNTIIDEQKPYLIDIGDNVKITEGVIILTHGYDWAVLKNIYGAVLGSAGKVKIGNNVFIGMNTLILKDVEIGDNVVIGAGSVVTKNIPPNSVVAGNPARYIMSIEEYYEKRVVAQLKEAQTMFNCYVERYNKIPNKEVFREFFQLFQEPEEVHKLNPVFKEVLELEGTFDKSYSFYSDMKRQFNNYEEFVKYCLENK